MEGPHTLTNQKWENLVFSLLIGQNLRTLPDNTVLYNILCLLEKELGFYATLASELDSVVEYEVESEIIHFSKF